MNITKNLFPHISIPQNHQEIAIKFASEQATKSKGKRIYFNTLAIYTVHDFLEWMQVETDLSQGESWHPGIRALLDVADLVIPSLGKIECRPVLPGETVISLPVEVTEDRIAYVGVQFQEKLNEVQLLGFCRTLAPETTTETIELASLEPIETLIDYIDRLESANFFLQSDDEVAVKVRERLLDQPLPEIIAQLERIDRTCDKGDRRYISGELLANYLPPPKPNFAFRGNIDDSQKNELQNLAGELLEKLDEIWSFDGSDELTTAQQVQPPIALAVTTIPGSIKLDNWLNNIDALLESGFQTLETFLSNLQGDQVFRFANAPRSRGKETEKASISITGVKEIPFAEHNLALIVSCQSENTQTVNIVLRLYLTGENIYLPSNVKLMVLDGEEVFLEAIARDMDNWMQLEFSGEVGEGFTVKVAIDNSSISHNFII